MLLKLALAKMEEPEPVQKPKMIKANISKKPELSYGCNPQVPSFSSAIFIEYSKKFGRHVVANRDINTGRYPFENLKIYLIYACLFIGDVLILEESIISSIFVDVHRDFCNFCFKNCIALIPCNICGFVRLF
jgi:hypothetical protein